MARSRNIKPSFFTNELLGVYDPIISLMFAGLWCLADKDGRLEDRPLRIKAELFPYRDSLDINGYLTVLERDGFISRYQVGDGKYIQVENFTKHQSPHHTEKSKGFPPKPIDSIDKKIDNGETPLNNGEITVPTRSDSLIPDSLIEDSLIPEKKPSSRQKTKNGTRLPKGWQPNERHQQIAQKSNLSLSAECQKFMDHHEAKGSLFVSWDAAFRTWLGNAAEWNKNKPSNKTGESIHDKRANTIAALTGQRPNEPDFFPAAERVD